MAFKRRPALTYVSITAAAVIIIFVIYRLTSAPADAPLSAPLVAERLSDGGLRASTSIQYYVGNEEEAAHFIVTVGKNGLITGVATVDPATQAASSHQEEFSQELLKIIKGKRLSELGALDKVGKSSITTEAFNTAIPTLQAQVAAARP